MSWHATAYVKRLSQVSPYEKLLLFVLADYHNTQRGAAWPSVKSLAEDSLMTERNCFKLLDKLSRPREGHPEGIIRKRKTGVGRGFITEYLFVELDCEQAKKPENNSPFTAPNAAQNPERKNERKPENGGTTIRKEQNNQETKKQNHHAYGELNDWINIKETLKTQLPPEEFNHWVRPLYLLKVMGKMLLLALPPSGAMVKAARARAKMLRSLLQERGYEGFVLTHYPDHYQRERLRNEHPDFHRQMFGTCRTAGDSGVDILGKDREEFHSEDG